VGYSKDQLETSLLHLLSLSMGGIVAYHYLESAGLPTACTHAAELCFINKITESRETEIVREALKDLNTDAQFHWGNWKKPSNKGGMDYPNP
jgi:hypothetical protein